MVFINIRHIEKDDFLILRDIAKCCKPLDVHTPYTYWVVCNFFGEGCFIIEDNNEVIGSIMTIKTNDSIFIWQIAIKESYRRRGLSDILYQCVEDYARKNNISKLLISIAPENENNNQAISKYCEKHNLKLIKSGNVNIKIPNEGINEYEYLYEIILNST